MEAVAFLQKAYQQWGAYLLGCLDAPYSAVACRPFWSWVSIGSASLGAIGLLWLIWKFVDYKLKYAAAIRAEIERERIAEPDVMEDAIWKGDSVFNALEAETQTDVASEIRVALARRKLAMDKPI